MHTALDTSRQCKELSGRINEHKHFLLVKEMVLLYFEREIETQ
jgi:hypothetical protein